MLDSKCIVFLLSTILVFCESSIVDNLQKCDINDGDCTSKSWESALRYLGESGDPKLGIPAIDPIELKNLTFYILDLLNITLVEGSVKNIKDCKVEKMVTDVEKEHGSMKLFCKTLIVKGLYEAFASNPIIKTVLGGKSDTANGEGNFKVAIGNLYITLNYDIYIQKRGEDNYIKSKRDKYLYDYNIGKMTFYVDGLHAGAQDISPLVTSMLNENWKSLMSSFGKTFMDKSMAIVHDYVHKFFDAIPCKYYISTDLTKYAKP